MRTVAEYVETPLILAKLREIGVDCVQGHAIHKPCPIGEQTARGPRAWFAGLPHREGLPRNRQDDKTREPFDFSGRLSWPIC